MDYLSFISKYAKTIAVILVLLLAAYILVEQSVRVYLFGWDAFSFEKVSSNRPIEYSENLKSSDIQGLSRELKPGLDTVFKLESLQTNSRGLRDSEYPFEKPPHTFRVAVVGGSYTMGEGIAIADTFHSRLEERLNKEDTGMEYEFINFGVSGYTIGEKILLLEHKVLAYDPDLVLFVLDGSQFVDNKASTSLPPMERLGFFNSYSYKLLRKVKILPGRNKKALNFTRQHLRRLFRLDHALFKVAKFSEDRGIPVAVVVLDHDYQHNRLGNKIEKKVKNRKGLYFSNTLPVFRHKRLGEYSIYKVDRSPNEEANRLFAEILYWDLKRQGLLGEPESEAADKE